MNYNYSEVFLKFKGYCHNPETERVMLIKRDKILALDTSTEEDNVTDIALTEPLYGSCYLHFKGTIDDFLQQVEIVCL